LLNFACTRVRALKVPHLRSGFLIFIPVMEPESAKHTDNIELKSWLDSLQQESWQLELLISGFSTFLLIQGLGWFEGLSYDLTLLEQQSDRFALLDILHHFGRIGWMSLLISLLFHVVMRGLWISAIGLRSVSGEIDYTTFRFRPRYVKRLQNGIGSFDDYIDRLERYCSVLFSFAFLLLFCFLGISCYVFTVGVVMNLPEFLGVEQNELVETITEAIGLIILILGVIYMLDFFTLGLLKRIKWIEKPYYYLYVAMGWITLARFYRPLYYNFTDNSFGRKFAVILPFCVMIIYFGSAVEYVGASYRTFPPETTKPYCCATMTLTPLECRASCCVGKDLTSGRASTKTQTLTHCWKRWRNCINYVLILWS